MKAELYLKAECDEDEEQISDWIALHFQTYVQDFLESDADDSGREITVKLPDMIYKGKNGNIIKEVRQGN